MDQEKKKKIAERAGTAGFLVGSYYGIKNAIDAKSFENMIELAEKYGPKEHFENTQNTALRRMRGRSIEEKRRIAKAVRKLRKLYGYDNVFGSADFDKKLHGIASRVSGKEIEKLRKMHTNAQARSLYGIAGAFAAGLGGQLAGKYLAKESADDSDDKEIARELLADRAKAIPFAAGSIYLVGEGASRLADVAAKGAREYELLARRHVAEANRLAERARMIAEEAANNPEKSDAFLRASRRYARKASKEMKIAGAMSMFGSRGGGGSLASFGSSAKYGAIPLGILGLYHYASKLSGGEGLASKNIDPSALNAIGTAATVLGSGMVAKSLWRPVIKPMLKRIRGDLEPTAEIERPSVRFGTIKDRMHAVESAANASAEKVKSIDESGIVADAKLGAIGSSLAASGGALMYVSPSKEDVLETKARALDKKGSFVADGLLAHLGQNAIIKGRLHSGAMYRKALQYIQEGNAGRVENSKISALGDGFYSGTIDPDSSVLRRELRELGASLKRAGVDLDNLDPAEKAALYAVRKGRVDMLAAILPESRIARMVVLGDEKVNTAAARAAVEKAITSIPASKWKEINKQFRNSSVRKLIMAGTKDGSYGYEPARDRTYLSDLLNRVNDRIRSSKAGKSVVEFLGRDVDDVLKIKKRKMSLDEARKLEEAGRQAGIATSLLLEPSLGVWNYVKPKLSSTPFADTYAKYSYAYHAALGASGHKFGKVKPSDLVKNKARAQAYVEDISADYLLSPTLGMTGRVMYDSGALMHSMLKSGLKPEEYKKVIEDLRIRETVLNPRSGMHNLRVDKLEKDIAVDNIERKLMSTGSASLAKAKKQIRDAVKKGLERGAVGLSDLEGLKPIAANAGAKHGAKMIRKSVTSDFSEAEQLTKAQKKYDEFARSYGVLGLVGGGVALTAPAYVAELKGAKEMDKHASDDKESVAYGALLGAATGGYASAYADKLKSADVQSVIASIDALQGADPVEAKEMLDAIKKKPGYKYVRDKAAFKKIEREIENYYDAVRRNATESEEAKRLLALKKKIDDLRFYDPKQRGPFRAAVDMLIDGARLKSGGEPRDEKMRRLARLKSEVGELIGSVQKRNKKIARDMQRSVKEGRLAEILTQATKEGMEAAKPRKTSIVKGGLIGSAVGALGALAMDSAYKKMTGSEKNISPYLAGYTLLGGIAGGGLATAERSLSSRYASMVSDMRSASPKQKARRILLSALAGRLPRTTEEAIETLESPVAVFDKKRFGKALRRDRYGSVVRDIDYVAPLAATGALGGMVAGAHETSSDHVAKKLGKE